jgi:hypothetical protein
MDIFKLTISGFESPLLMGIKISDSNIVNDDIINKSISINTNLHIKLSDLSVGDDFAFIRNIEFLYDL